LTTPEVEANEADITGKYEKRTYIEYVIILFNIAEETEKNDHNNATISNENDTKAPVTLTQPGTMISYYKAIAHINCYFRDR
jgi:hypothetical protein